MPTTSMKKASVNTATFNKTSRSLFFLKNSNIITVFKKMSSTHTWLPLRGAVGIAVCGVFFWRPMIATTNIYYLLSIFVYSLLCTIDLYAGLIILPQPITSSSLCAHQPTILEIAKSGVYISVGMPSIL